MEEEGEQSKEPLDIEIVEWDNAAQWTQEALEDATLSLMSHCHLLEGMGLDQLSSIRRDFACTTVVTEIRSLLDYCILIREGDASVLSHHFLGGPPHSLPPPLQCV